MKNKDFIVQVAPITPLPFSKMQVFSYIFGELLEKGTLVSVPFYYRNIEGIVISSAPYFTHEGSFRLKKIGKVIELPSLTEKQIDLAYFLSSYYLAPLGVVLKSMIPKRVAHRPTAKKGNEKEKKNNSKEKNIKYFKGREIAIFGPKKKRKAYLINLIKATIQSGKQCLVLVPEIFHALELSDQLKKIFPERGISLIHSKIAKGKIYYDWKEIRNNKIKIIVTTKIGVFLPFSSLGAIVVMEPQDVSHKQNEAMPRFNAVEAAEFLARSHGAKIVYSSSMLSVKNYLASKEGKLKTINFRKNLDGPKTNIVNLAFEKKKADLPVSELLYNSLARAIKSKNQSFILVNRKGLSTFSKCQNCGQILKCPKCKKALVYFEEHSEYQCLHCSHKADLLSSCPSCGGFQFSHHGIGIQLVEKKLKKLFPSAIISRLDSDVMKSAKKYKRVKNDFESGKTSVLVGTQIAARDICGKNLSLVGVVAAHDFLNLPDFGSRENALSTLFQAKDLLGKNGIFVVQTFIPDDPVMGYLGGENQDSFFESEIKFRKKMGYPPFVKLVKLIFRGSSRKIAAEEAKKIFDDLTVRGNNEIEIGDPYESLASGKRGFFMVNLIIKIPANSEFSDLPIFHIIKNLKRGWAVDIDPVSTI